MDTDTQGAVAEPTDVAPDLTDATPEVSDQSPTDAPPAEPDAPSPEGTEAPADPASPASPEIPVPATPFEGGEPFAFRVDGRQITPDGAKVLNDHVVIPVGTWRSQMQHLLADRGAIKEREQQYRAVVARHQQAEAVATQRADALTAEIADLFSDPAKLQAAFENWQINGPRIMAEMQARAAQRELASYRDREAQQEQERQEAALVPQMQDHLGGVLEQLLQDHGIAWNTEADRWANWMRAIWEDFGPNVLYPKGPDGKRYLDEEKVVRLFQREAGRAKVQQVASKVAEQKVATNTAAIAPPKPKAPVPVKAPPKPQPKAERPRNAEGQFTRQNADDWEREFFKTQYHKEL